MNKRIKAGIYATTLSLCVAFLPNASLAKSDSKTFTAQMKTRYTTEELLDILKKGGFQVEKIESQNRISISVNGDKFLLANDYKGDLQFVDFYSNNKGVSLSKVNAWNGEIRYGKAYMDDDIDALVVEYLLPTDAGLSSQQIIQGVKDFLMIKRSFEKAFED